MTDEKTGTILDYQSYSPLGSPDDPSYRGGEPSTHPLGVAFHGPWEKHGDGFNEHTRRNARALALTGCPVHLRSTGRSFRMGAPSALPASVAPLLTASVARYSVLIHQMVIQGAMLHGLMTNRFLPSEENVRLNQRRVIYSVWERDRVSEDTAKWLSAVGQVWTGCEANRRMLVACGVESPIHVIPLPFFDGDPLSALRGRKRKPGVPRFYHIGKWEPRKAQDKIILAFLRAFRPGQAQLIMRSSSLSKPVDGYPQGARQSVLAAMRDPAVRKSGWTPESLNAAIELLEKPLLDKEIVALHSFGDVYVTLSRGEGFDMPAFDAKLAGNMMVYTPSGGPQSFAESADPIVGEMGSVDCHPMYGWEPDAQYIDFSTDQASKAMQIAAGAMSHGWVSRSNLDAFRAENVGQRMLTHLQELVEKVY